MLPVAAADHLLNGQNTESDKLDKNSGLFCIRQDGLMMKLNFILVKFP